MLARRLPLVASRQGAGSRAGLHSAAAAWARKAQGGGGARLLRPRRALPALGLVAAGGAAGCGCAATLFVALPDRSVASCDAPTQAQLVAAAAAAGCCLASTYLLWPASSPRPEEPEHSSAEVLSFFPSASFQGAKEGYVFTTGQDGTGYYTDSGPKQQEEKRDPAAKAAPGYKTTSSGLQYRDVVVGNGRPAAAGSTVKVHYTGRLYSNRVLGQKFDSSRDRGVPLAFPIGRGQVIPGWEEGILGISTGEAMVGGGGGGASHPPMNVGGKRTLIIPPHLGYGPRGAGPIPPNATLHFEVELVDQAA